MNEEIIIINDEPFYKILNGTSYDYAPIPKEFKPYFEKLQQENKQLKEDFKLLKELQMRTNEANQKYKEVIEEVRERIDIIKPIYKSYIWYNELERMLNKAKEVVKDE